MKRSVMAIALALAAGAAGPASADPHMNFHSSTTLPDGSSIALTGTFRTDVDTNADGTTTAFNEATLEIELQPAPAATPGSTVPGPSHFRVTARVDLSDLQPCIMPASFLVALGLVTPADVQRIMGFTPTLTETTGSPPPIGDLTQRVTGLLLAQTNTMKPSGAAAASQLAALAFGTIPPPTNDSVCLPETPPPSTTP